MGQTFEDAHRVFRRYAALEPALAELWTLCRRVQPPQRNDLDEDETDPAEGWCAEDFFLQEIKGRLQLLVGWYRPRDPQELRTARAYEEVHAALFDFALARPCACCRERTGVDEGPTLRI